MLRAALPAPWPRGGALLEVRDALLAPPQHRGKSPRAPRGRGERRGCVRGSCATGRGGNSSDQRRQVPGARTRSRPPGRSRRRASPPPPRQVPRHDRHRPTGRARGRSAARCSPSSRCIRTRDGVSERGEATSRVSGWRKSTYSPRRSLPGPRAQRRMVASSSSACASFTTSTVRSGPCRRSPARRPPRAPRGSSWMQIGQELLERRRQLLQRPAPSACSRSLRASIGCGAGRPLPAPPGSRALRARGARRSSPAGRRGCPTRMASDDADAPHPA